MEETNVEKEKTLEKYNQLKDKLLSFLKPETSIVKKLVKFYNNKKNYDEMVGWTNGVNAVNQRKNYHQGNYQSHFIGKDKLSEIPKKNVFFPCVSLVDYYLKQEDKYKNLPFDVWIDKGYHNDPWLRFSKKNN